MIRVTGGVYRGMLLHCPRDIRPTSGRIKEYIFSQISQYLVGAKVLDLFAGSGALGIEAVSRRAAEVVFVDISRRSYTAIQKNINKIGFKGRIIRTDAIHFIRSYKSAPFDLILIDPPYQEFDPHTILGLIEESSLLNEGGHLVYELTAGKPEPETQSLQLISFRTLSDTTVGIWFR